MINNCEKLEEYLIKEIRKRTDLATIGISGGADSTLVACLCTRALGNKNVYGVSMPPSFQPYIQAKELTDYININLDLVSIYSAWVELIYSINCKNKLSKLNLGNMQARIRMIVLYTINCNLAEIKNKRSRVIGTGNLSEDFIGYDTKGGDSLCDFFPIGELYKSEVYQLLNWYKDMGMIEESHIDRTPSAGLWEGQTDENELGYSYNEMEPSIHKIRRPEGIDLEVEMDNDIDKFVMDRYKSNKHKHEAPEVISVRENYCE